MVLFTIYTAHLARLRLMQSSQYLIYSGLTSHLAIALFCNLYSLRQDDKIASERPPAARKCYGFWSHNPISTEKQNFSGTVGTRWAQFYIYSRWKASWGAAAHSLPTSDSHLMVSTLVHGGSNYSNVPQWSLGIDSRPCAIDYLLLSYLIATSRALNQELNSLTGS
jgi:hypothetical protein